MDSALDLASELTRRFQRGRVPSDVGEIVMALLTGAGDPLIFMLSETAFEVHNDADPNTADVTFIFDAPTTAAGVIYGDQDPIQAFMEGRFRSDGYLMLIFILLGAFDRDR